MDNSTICKENIFEKAKEIHKVWHKFYKWTSKTFGKDLYSEWKYMEFGGTRKKLKYRNFDDNKLYERLGGYEAMKKIEQYVKRYCPEIKIVPCDDEVFASSFLLLIPHPKMGISIIFVSQLSSIQNFFFLYKGHCDCLINTLNEMKYVYEGVLGDEE